MNLGSEESGSTIPPDNGKVKMKVGMRITEMYNIYSEMLRKRSESPPEKGSNRIRWS